uniref:Cwf21 domain-containing protein n=1 Tax=Steinernema glaseri TaxID=37863 RepID=A0A1I8AJT2_9BILA
MYNAIGLGTARGSGTNGYVQSNLSSLPSSKNRTECSPEEAAKKAEAELNRKPNSELLEHMRRRQIELKCVELEDVMENKGFAQDEIERKVGEYRKLLLDEIESGELNLDKELDLKNEDVR